jgi:hypothetical protein
MLGLPEDGAEALKYVGVFIKYFNMCACAFVGINNKRYKIHGVYIKVSVYVFSNVHWIIIQYKKRNAHFLN